MALKDGIPVDLETLVDLTLPIHAGMPVSIRERPVVVERRMTHQRDGICASSLEMGTHAGTHIDAPYHFYEEGSTADLIPLASLILPGCVLNVREPPLRLDAARIARTASVWGGLKPGTGVVLWTGWDRFFGLTEMHGHPYLAKDAARLLVDAGAAVVAIDAIGVDDSMGSEFPAHELLLGAGVPIVENLRGLKALGAGPCGIAFIPLLIQGADAAPVRAFGWRAPP